MKQVTNRNGQLVPFNFSKIEHAVRAAMQSVSKGYSDEEQSIKTVLRVIKNTLDMKETATIDEIQKIVEDSLMCCGQYDAARSYIEYRKDHKDSRFIAERIDYMNQYALSTSNAATSSETDANANVTMKNVANLEGEVYKTTNRIIQRQRMKDKLNELYPEVAKQYEKDLDHHIIYVHDEASSPVLKYYCQAVSLYPLMCDGVGKIDGVTPGPPNDLQSFSGQLTNLAFLLSAQCKGAVAFGEALVALSWYVEKEYGDKWWEHLDDPVSTNLCKKTKTIKSEIKKALKQIIYGVNQPAGNRSYNSPFTNFSIYDKTYFNALFEDFRFPDGTSAKWEAVDCIQRIFMQLRRELNLIKPLTFPVTTIALVNDGTDIIDKEYKEFCAEEWANGSSHFCYNSNNPTSLASCCFNKDQKVLWKSSTSGVHLTTLEELHNTPWEPEKKNLKIFHNGSWIAGKSIKLDATDKMYKVTTYNNKEFIMTDNHINVTLNGEKSTSNLTTDDYLMFNTLALNAVPENDEHLSYAQGFVVGAFLGDGSFGSEINGTIYEIQFSQNYAKYEKLMKYLDIANLECGGQGTSKLKTIHNNVYPVRISSKELASFIIKWTNWTRGTYAFNKKLNLNCLLQSYEFRKGILDGWYNTDGGNSNRCYTTSLELAECMEALLTSLGLQSIVNISNRTNEPVIIRDEVYTRNYPLYCVRWYELANHRVNKDANHTWIKKNNSIYFRIKSIEEIDYKDPVYCIECRDKDEPYFTLPCGLITHNCRVLNEITENTFSSINGLQGIMTGSCNVITLNINRIVQDFHRKMFAEGHEDHINNDVVRWHASGFKNSPDVKKRFKDYLISILERVYKYHIAFKTMLYESEDKGMFASSNGDYIYMKKLYSTIGIIGYQEAAMFLGLEISKNKEYIDFLNFILGIIKEENKKHSINDKKRPFKFNSEAIPGENLAVKCYEWDKSDGYFVPTDRNLYASYFYNPWDNTSVLDKLYLHGGEISKSTDGGQAAHINLDQHLTKEQYLKLIDYSTKNGVNYFTFNIPISECKNCGHVVSAPIKECPKCNSKNIDYWTRIIGYLRPVSAFSNPRQIEEKQRVYNNEIGEETKIK